MLNAILGKKIGQTQKFTEEGKRLPATLIEAGPCPVIQIKTQDKNGYLAVQLGFGQRTKHVTKQIAGHIKGAKQEKAPRFFKEIRIKNPHLAEASRGENESGVTGELKVGDLVKVNDVFQAGDKIQVVGTSKGKGYAGVVKRWGFKGGPRTHGQSDRERAPGSIGSTTTPGRVYKGKKMAGRMGQDKVTIAGLEVLSVEAEKNLLVVKGLVPGPKNGLLLIEKV